MFSFFKYIVLLLFIVVESSHAQVNAVSQMDSSEDKSLYLPFQQDKGWILASYPWDEPENQIHIDSLIIIEKEIIPYIVKSNGVKGVISSYGDTLVPFEFNQIDRISNGFIATKKDSSYCFHHNPNSKKYSFVMDSLFTTDEMTYIYHNGKVGAYINETFIPPNFEAIERYQCSPSRNTSKLYFKVITSNGYYQLIDEESNFLLTNAVTDIHCYDYGYIRFFDKNWQYYNTFHDVIIDSEGNDINIYNEHCYKKYNTDRTNSALYYIENNERFSNTYADYFPLSEDFIAVKKDSLIGLVDLNSKNEVIKPKYHQINVTSKRNLFKAYLNESCGLINSEGEELIPLTHANIITTTNDSLFIVLENNKGGVKNRNNKLILPIEYGHISIYDSTMLIFKNSKFGLTDLNGKTIIPPEYNYYELKTIRGINYFEFYNDINNRSLVNYNGYLIKDGASHIEYGPGVIKYYAYSKIKTLAIDDFGNVEDSHTYSKLKSFIVGDNESSYPFNRNSISWEGSDLEEHQLTGKYGKRKHSRKGMSIEPNYSFLRKSYYNKPYGEILIPQQEQTFLNSINLSFSSKYNLISEGGVEGITMTENVAHNSIPFSGSELIQGVDLTFKLIPNTNIEWDFDQFPIEQLLYAENTQNNIRKLYHGGTAEICNRSEADISLKTYFNWFNKLGVFTVSVEDAKRIMDPYLGVEFKNTKQIAVQARYGYEDPNKLNFIKPEAFKAFNFLNGTNLFVSQSMHKNAKKIREFNIDKDSTRKSINGIVDVELIEPYFGNQLKIKSVKPINGIVNVNYPNFCFVSTDVNIEYHAGVIVQKVDSANYRLITPSNKLLLDCLSDVKYLGADKFAVKQIGERHLSIYDVNLTEIVLDTVLSVEKFNKGFLALKKLTNKIASYHVYDKDMNMIISSPSNVSYYRADKYWIDKTKRIVKDFNTGEIDTLRRNDIFLGNQLIYNSTGKIAFIRKYGTQDSISIKTNKLPKVHGNFIFYKDGNRYYIMDQDLNIERQWWVKKIDKINEDFLALRTNRKTRILNNKNNEVYVIKDNEQKFVESRNYMYFYTDESLLYGTKNGDITSNRQHAYDALKIKDKISIDKNEYLIQKASGEQIQQKFTHISARDNHPGEYLVGTESLYQIYDLNLNEIPILTGNDIYKLQSYMLVRQGSHFQLYDLNNRLISIEERFYVK